MGLAHTARDHFDLAKDALMSAYEIEPKNEEVLTALKQLKKNKDNYRVRRAQVAKEMISGGAGAGAVEEPEVAEEMVPGSCRADAAEAPQGSPEEATETVAPRSP